MILSIVPTVAVSGGMFDFARGPRIKIATILHLIGYETQIRKVCHFFGPHGISIGLLAAYRSGKFSLPALLLDSLACDVCH